MSSDLKKWKTTNSQYLVDDNYLKLRLDSCTTADGHVIDPYYVFEYPDWANCFVIDDNLNVIMVNHYRHGVDKYIPELVSGGIETTDTDPTEGMRRELEEEIGYTGGVIEKIGVSYANPASHTNKVHSFIAYGGSCNQQQQLEKGESLQIMKLSFQDFIKLVNNPENIFQSNHLAAIYFALNFIKKSNISALKHIKSLLLEK